jgi:hypothetical protein
VVGGEFGLQGGDLGAEFGGFFGEIGLHGQGVRGGLGFGELVLEGGELGLQGGDLGGEAGARGFGGIWRGGGAENAGEGLGVGELVEAPEVDFAGGEKQDCEHAEEAPEAAAAGFGRIWRRWGFGRARRWGRCWCRLRCHDHRRRGWFRRGG